MTFAEKIISFYKELDFRGSLPTGVGIMNPYKENPEIIPLITRFYSKYYNDNRPRHLIIGINPGRFGAGTTGIPFTDTKRLIENCGLVVEGMKTFEPSSAFIYEMIDAYGGPEKFYTDFYISAVSPLGFTTTGKVEKAVNYNYYDSRELTESILEFVKESLEKQLGFGIVRDILFCIGTGKNYRFVTDFNNEHKYFNSVVPLEHPRFIMQYKTKQKDIYISKYLTEFSKIRT